MQDLWPHQQYAIDEVIAALGRGERRILLSSPTGAGKTRVECELIDRWVAEGKKVALYTNRKVLIEQTSRVLVGHGIDHGMRAAGYEGEDFCPVQISSIQTEESRVFKKQSWGLHDADAVLIDEAHIQTGRTVRKILDAHIQEGAFYVGLTATPLGLADLYDCLIQAGTTSELRACGALVPALHYGPDEPDLRKFKKLRAGEDLSEEQARSAMMRPGIWGRVWEWYCKLNPDRNPAILFAPGVQESVWFAQQFEAKGVPAAHLDGQHVWVGGELYPTTKKLREEVLHASKSGAIAVLCNRFVLREGVDCPWLAHGILATVFGSLQTYLQAGGRLLRAHPGLESVTVQDHGGNWWRHGSLNADREWRLEYTASMIAGLREDRLRGKKDPQPMRCPKCGKILGYPRCRECNWTPGLGEKVARPVVSTDGELVELSGDIFKERRVSKLPNGSALWQRMYWKSIHREATRLDGTPYWTGHDRTFRAAAALFAKENNWGWPDPAWPLMPTESLAWFRLVKDVPMDSLIGYCAACNWCPCRCGQEPAPEPQGLFEE